MFKDIPMTADAVVRDQIAPEAIVERAILEYKPVARYVGYSGGRDSTAVVHWAMNNVPDCEVFHINTGIGIERVRQHVRDTCKTQGWPLHEVRANEDCGQDYEKLILKHGFPGPDGHSIMYSRLKERAIRVLVRRAQTKRGDRVMLLTGIRHDESARRMRYAGREVNPAGSQLWVSPIYWWDKAQRDVYNAHHDVPISPISQQLGMSGECLCGAYAQPGELERVRAVCPETAERIDRLQDKVLQAGFTWSWEGRPPKGGFNRDQQTLFRPLCVGCEKSAVVQAEIAA